MGQVSPLNHVCKTLDRSHANIQVRIKVGDTESFLTTSINIYLFITENHLNETNFVIYYSLVTLTIKDNIIGFLLVKLEWFYKISN